MRIDNTRSVAVPLINPWKKYPYFISAIALLFALLLPSSAKANDFRFFTIGTGGITGVYYSAGNAICKLINKNFIKYKMRCSVESTPGSDFNVKAVRDKKLMFGLVQGGIQHDVFFGEGDFANETPYKNMRAVLSLHSEAYTIMVNPNSGIKSLYDLEGARVDIGALNSGTRIGAKKLLNLAGFKENEFSKLTSLKPDQTTQALCSNEIDAYIFMVGHPARNPQESTRRCKAKIVGINGIAASRLDRIPYFYKTLIPGGIYQYNEANIATYAVRATLVTDRSTPEDVVYSVVKSIMEDFERFKQMHPALSSLNLDSMVNQGLTAPFHKGAKKYYEEKGLL